MFTHGRNLDWNKFFLVLVFIKMPRQIIFCPKHKPRGNYEAMPNLHCLQGSRESLEYNVIYDSNITKLPLSFFPKEKAYLDVTRKENNDSWTMKRPNLEPLFISHAWSLMFKRKGKACGCKFSPKTASAVTAGWAASAGRGSGGCGGCGGSKAEIFSSQSQDVVLNSWWPCFSFRWRPNIVHEWV